LAGYVQEHKYGGGRLLGHSEADSKAWIQFSRRVLEAQSNSPCTIHDASRNEHLKNLSSVAGTPSLRFCAVAPIASKADIAIGYVLVVDTGDHGGLSDHEAATISAVAKQCMRQLEQVYEIEMRRRWSRMTEGLSTFLQRRPAVDQMLENPPNFSDSSLQAISKQSAKSMRQDEEESQGEPETNESVIPRPQQLGPPSPNKQKPITEEEDETPYRRGFRRAAEYLRTALDADGVLFADGLVGFHGTLQPAAEPETELQREMVQADKEKVSQADSEQRHENTHSRKFTSTDYRKDAQTGVPAEILGIAMHPDTVKPTFQQLTESTLGLSSVDEGFLQYLMEKHPQGKIWYLDNGSYCCEGDAISSDDRDDIQRLTQTFHGIRQLLFGPLKDPVDIKRLAGCFVWSTRIRPMLTNADLPSLDTFAHIVEAEISRIDTMTALKQKESFMASVSHELRSPLHGILGAVELLLDSGLDSFQESMADTISACGTTLHETLSSVLSYTKINQFERRGVHPRQKLPSLSPWSLENKDLPKSENPDGMFVCTNVAELCEEVSEVVLSDHRSDLAVTLEVAYRDWNFWTEPGALRRIMMNIIGNALKYTSEGGIDISLHVERNDADKDKTGGDPLSNIIVFTVKDSGKGMSSAFLENHLFVPFSQEDAMSDGVGLGMSIVKSLVALLAGQMKVESHRGEGTTVMVKMPMRVAERQANLDKNVVALRERAMRVAASPTIVEATLRGYLEGWFGCTLVSWEDAELAFVADEELPLRKKNWPAIVAVGRRMTKLRRTSNDNERITEPFGPGKVSKALLRCLQSGDKTNISETFAGASSKAAPKAEGPRTGDDSDGQNLDAQNTMTKSTSSMSRATESIPDAWSATTPTPNEKATDAERARARAILLVEDNHINLRLLQTYVEKRGYQNVQTAKNGLLAVQAVERRKGGFNVIVMDISMPEMDGFEATRRIRGVEQRRHQPPAMIIALTGLASASDRAKAYECGMNRFMTKPLKFQELGSLLAGREEI